MKMPGKIALLSISTRRRQIYTASVKLLLLKQQGDGTYLWCIKIPTGLLHQSSCTCSNNMQRQEKIFGHYKYNTHSCTCVCWTLHDVSWLFSLVSIYFV